MSHMSNDNKRFYWLKLPNDFFNRKDIKVIESQKNGSAYVLFYLKLLTESIQYNGDLRFNEAIPFNDEILATITNTDIDIVRTAFKLFQNLGLLEILEDETIHMIEAPRMLGSETASTIRSRKSREKKAQKQLATNDKMLQCNSDATNCNREIDIDIEKDIDIYINNNIAQKNLSDSVLTTLFNRFWNAYPRKVGKDKCFNWFKRNKSKINNDFIEDLVKAIELQLTSIEWQNEKFIPYPQTWLNRGGWEDQLTYHDNYQRDYAEGFRNKWGNFLNGN